MNATFEARIDEAIQAWPQFSVERDAFAHHVRASGVDPAELAIADFYLAFACARGDVAAIAAFERTLLTEVAAYIARMDSDPQLADDVRQLLRERLLVGPAPKIATYSGRGPLGAWLRTVAVRAASELVRARKPYAPLDEARPAGQPDPELDYLKTRYATEVGEAFAAVLAALPQKERNILRLHFFDGMTIEAIAGMYAVHRMTVSRWIATWREEIFAATQRLLRERLKVSPEELESLLALVQSRIDISIRRYLA